jgi:hypothetical protein
MLIYPNIKFILFLIRDLTDHKYLQILPCFLKLKTLFPSPKFPNPEKQKLKMPQ